MSHAFPSNISNSSPGRKQNPLFAIVSVIVLLLMPCFSNAQITFGPAKERVKSEVAIRELNTLNLAFLQRQRENANNLVRIKLGRQLYGKKDDLRVLQRAIDRGLLEGLDKESLQSFGASMGDVFVSSHKNLNWKVYEDELGPSHAVCLDDSEHCIFPMTLISRRVEAGLTPNVTKIYNDVYASIKPYFPKLPYSREQ